MRHATNSILVVDDDDAIRESVCDLLGDFGYRVRQARDGKAACQALTTHRDIWMIVTDLRMPRLDGAGLLAWCRARNLRIPVVVMSADQQLSMQAKRTLASCGASFIHKPFDTTSLIDLVESAQADTKHDATHPALVAPLAVAS